MIIYAQKNYSDPLGIPPTVYTIAQAGCFITSFCNLESRFGRPIDPPNLNAYLRNNNLYLNSGDGSRDDVGWGTITSYDSNTVVTGIGGASMPPNNNSIVKFIYNNGASTHFCLVNDINTGTIIDSWDGLVKSVSFYGGVKAWASYNNKGGNMSDLVNGDIDNLLKDFGLTPAQSDYDATKLSSKDFAYWLQSRLKNCLIAGDVDNLLKDVGITPTQADYDALKAGPKNFAYYLQTRFKRLIQSGGVTKASVIDYINKNLQ